MSATWMIFATYLLYSFTYAKINVGTVQERAKEYVNSSTYRLPKSVIPDKYVIYLVPFHPEQFKFKGNVTITLNITEATDRVTLHANIMEIDNWTITKTSTEGVPVSVNETFQTESTDDHQFFILYLNDTMTERSQYAVSLWFTGELRDDMFGFYRSSYTFNNEVRWIAATQFSMTQARRAFPCFDEPTFKAKFQINIAHYNNLTALSNMPRMATSDPDPELNGRVWDRFYETVPMSTYLVGFVVTDFKNITNDYANFTVWAREDSIENGNFSQIIGMDLLQELERYTGIGYPLPKIDQVALPDFAAGAMENWGLVTYRETSLLFDEKESTATNRANIAMIIGHELSHMWFGNLVSPDWWRYTWLKEGFARYFQYFITDQLEPTWRLKDIFVVAQQHEAFSTDSLNTTDSLNNDCNTPNEILAKFSTIAYNKGACVLRLIRHAITEETFRKGLQRYLNERQYSTAEPYHLYSALQEQATADNRLSGVEGTVEILFEKWASQPGYPVITVTRNYEENSATITQTRFFLATSDDSSLKWNIPLSWTSQSGSPGGFNITTPKEWFYDTDVTKIVTDIATNDEWVVFNNQESGYYRVNYDSENWNRIASFLESNVYENIHVVNRAQLLNDAFNLARAGQLSYETVLNVTRYLSREKDYIPWHSAFSGLSFINRFLRSSDEYILFVTYLLGLIESLYDSVGFEQGDGDDYTTILVRANALSWACNLGHEDCVSRGRALFNTILSNLRRVIYCSAVSNGDMADWNFLWDRYNNATLTATRTLIISALGCTKNTTILESYLFKSIDETSGIRKQDAAMVFSAVYANRQGVDIALDFLVQNLDNVTIFYGGLGALGNAILDLGDRLTLKSQVEKLPVSMGTPRIILLACVTALIGAATANPHHAFAREKREAGVNYRLPTSISPISYIVYLVPFHPEQFKFTGNVTITVNVTEVTNSVRLHANRLDIGSWGITNKVVTELPVSVIGAPVTDNSTTTDLHFLTLNLSRNLTLGQQYDISFNFTGTLEDDMYGFYRSSYTVDDEVRAMVKKLSIFFTMANFRWIAATQFESTSARRAFPCFDEPAFKAKFQINIARFTNMSAISNMPLLKTSSPDPELDGRVWEVFQDTTLPMSTYLVAFIVSDFASKSNAYGNFTVWARQEAIDQGDYSQDVGMKSLAILNDYTGIKYALPKVDQVALPDFAAGAMENWGLVTYRETGLLYDEKESTASNKASIAMVIAHELTHQWFGNLVTLHWWQYAWLNEGFARYFQYVIINEIEPLWRMLDQFVVAQQQSIFSTDSLNTTASLNSECSTPGEISSKFGSNTYSKGASVIRMIRHALTEETFKKGLRQYLNAR
uniref:Aminopeptidase N n=1 Tax=Timema cristinae TaxID=61476 RepID=A0A7R9D912_TIMCR|nr:unnamed protein product [Timema cristinae]